MNFERLINNIQHTHELLHASVTKAVNAGMTIRNWLIGYYIVEYEQKGEDRAGYGDNLLNNIAKETNVKGLSVTNLKVFRQFYRTYPEIGQTLSDVFNTVATPNGISLIGQTLSDQSNEDDKDHTTQNLPTALTGNIANIIAQIHSVDVPYKEYGLPPKDLIQNLSFSHIVELVKIDNPLIRSFYEIECKKGVWSVRELKRQIESLYFERSGLSKDKLNLSEFVNNKAIQLRASDVVNSPMTVEFLGYSDRALVTENDLEQALIDNLQNFLLELGHGFCFEARQKRILIDDEYYFVDLVFYHRILKCHVLVELKTEKFKHHHASQLNTYLNYFKEEVRQADDNLPVGILLCTDKGNTLVKYATAGLDENLFVQKYLVELPAKEDIEQYIKNEIRKEN